VRGYLADDVRGRAEAVEPDAFGVLPAKPQRAVADQPGAKERRGLQVRKPLRDRKAEALVGDRRLRIAAVDVVAGELRVHAEVLAIGAAKAARLVDPAEPRDADALPDLEPLRPLTESLDRSHDLMTGDERQLGLGQVPIDDVQIGAANPARMHAKEDLPGPGLRLGNLLGSKRLPLRMKNHGPHASIFPHRLGSHVRPVE
jgi:hypothetical protein